jgi:hypothetical protein
MQPLSRKRLLSMRADTIEAAKEASINQIVEQIYHQVLIKSRTEETKYVHILERNLLRKTGIRDSTGKEIDITVADIRDQLIIELKIMFPDCKIEYIERSPSNDIFTPPRRAVLLNPGQDGINRAIVIDWSMDG